MAGLYIHIPFCRQACHYCNFHFSTQLRYTSAMVEALCTELKLQKDFFGKASTLDTVYFGGGTPSLLSIDELQQIWDTIQEFFHVRPDAEITLEANPDDLSESYLMLLSRHIPVNRLSIGIQSFQEPVLQWMHRAHNAAQAMTCVPMARSQGFDNISIDLIYGLPDPFQPYWEKDLDIAMGLGVPHLSCYALTVESGTALGHRVQKGRQVAPGDEATAQQFLQLSHTVRAGGYRHYEISNISFPGYEARHNSSYWHGTPYLGIGPSAHSFVPGKRWWNVSNNARYMEALHRGDVPAQAEVLSPSDQYNELVMTSLRLEEGVDLDKLKERFGEQMLSYFLDQLKTVNKEHYIADGRRVYLTDTGRLWCDNISGTLFLSA